MSAVKKYHTGKLKYGSVSALMIVMVLAALIALNAGVYALEKKKGIMQNIFDFFAGIFR